MSAPDTDTIVGLKQQEVDARAELRRRLLEGGDTAEARAAVVDFGRSLKAEVARVSLNAKEKAEAKRAIRETGRRQLSEKLAGALQSDIAERVAPIAIPAQLKD